MKYYVGLDVSLKETSVCIVDQDGEFFKEGSVFTEPKDIAIFLRNTNLTFEAIGLETGNLSSWLCHELLADGLPAICIEATHAHAILKAQKVKTDKNDARGLAHIMRTGWFKAVHIKTHNSQKLRVLLNNRRCLLDKRIDIDNQIRGTLKVFGLKMGKVTPSTYEARVRELITEHPELQNFIEPILAVRACMIEQFKILDKAVIDTAKNDPVCRRLMTVPGVGVITALLFKTTIDQPGRFKKSKSVGANLGLTPRKYASGEIDYDGRITKCGDAMARCHLYEAAQVLMSRVAKRNDLKDWGMRIAKRSSMKNAYVAVARKMAVIMHRMWVDGTDFQCIKKKEMELIAA